MMNRLIGIPLICSGTFVGSAVAQCNFDADGPCDQPHSSPGCVVTECCDEVCNVDPICCELDWDQICIDIQEEACSGLTCPGAQPCDSPFDQPGCLDQICCRTVCDHDWYCCYIEWDQYCADFSAQICEQVACEIDVPEAADPEAESCDERINDGCNMLEPAYSQISCDQLIVGETTTSVPRDTDWYQFSIAEPARFTFTLESEFPAQALLFGGPCSGPFEVVSLFESILCSSPVQREVDLEPGTWSMVISPGREDISLRQGLQCPLDKLDEGEDPEPVYFGVRYLLSMQCNADPCSGDPDLNADGTVNGVDLTILLAGWGANGGLADIDCSGVVDGADLTRLLADWTG